MEQEIVQVKDWKFVWCSSDDDPRMTAQWELDHIRKFPVRSDQHRLHRLSEREDLRILVSSQSDVTNIDCRKSSVSQDSRRRAWHVLVDEKRPHLCDSANLFA